MVRLQAGLAKFVALARNTLWFLLIFVLVACSSNAAPFLSPQLVQKALTLQLDETQLQLSQQLVSSRSHSVKVHQVMISQQTALSFDKSTVYRVKGTFDATFSLSKHRSVQHQVPFELWLMPQKEGKTWRLIRFDQHAVPLPISQPIY